MTKFTNLIKPDSTELERYFLSVYTGHLWDALEKIKDWHSPEHIEKEVQMKLLKIQQQALTVVPEFVGSFLTDKSILGIANGLIPDDVISWVQEQTYYVDLEKIISHLISIKVTGFTVEKTQLFYLKHIDMSKRSRYFDFYLERDGDESLEHKRVDKGEKLSAGFNKAFYTFTQAEIDSMQTGSYKQIKVEE